ncbi:hypothetical protein AB0C12_21385 [Actinoplanes sp. NPDC048967]|uniref:hypothetical protein n=1 Tax=Actinoplanes sp. NPDC048967 TaxID=3155269 RepID=UPI0034025EAC
MTSEAILERRHRQLPRLFRGGTPVVPLAAAWVVVRPDRRFEQSPPGSPSV